MMPHDAWTQQSSPLNDRPARRYSVPIESTTPSPCLTEEVQADLVDGQLSDDALARIHGHAVRCEACRRLLAALAPLLNATEPGEEDSILNPPDSGEEEANDDAWRPPESFGEFRRERCLGRGGMGVVYLAYDISLDRRVAIKFIASKDPSPSLLVSFESEARALAQLQHPNVVTVFRGGQVDGRPYIVSEYVEGTSLAELRPPLPWRKVLAIGIDLARGLAAAHRKGILHRDIKPSNAIITDDGSVKLFDFGLAEPIAGSTAPWSSGTWLRGGTRRYMAPELHGGGPATPESDLYALGLVLHELSTGEVPRGRTLTRGSCEAPSAAASASGSTASRPNLEAITDPDFAALIERCLAPIPSERFASAEAFCDALERLEHDHDPAPLATNPYRGLEAFQSEHHAQFFGREASIGTLLDRLRRQPLMLVAGDSGLGKSSLCRAGVLPRIDHDAFVGGRRFSTMAIGPGRHPLQSLATALAPHLGWTQVEVVKTLEDTPVQLAKDLRARHEAERGLLLFVDQAEELVTLAGLPQAERFALFLAELALPSPGIRVLLAVRSDFLTRICALLQLGDEAQRALYLLPPMTREGVRDAIVRPARSRGVSFESEELIQTLVASTKDRAGSLPLLQFALAELWERRDLARACITRAALDGMGGVAGALSRHADGVLARLNPAEQEAARRLLRRLVTSQKTRGERLLEELVLSTDEAAGAALRALVEGRLVHAHTRGGQVRYELVHESLIESWDTLRRWIDDDAGHSVLRERLEMASAEWLRLERARDTLWGPRQLDEARVVDPASLGPLEQEFLLTSRRALLRQRRNRRLIALVVTLGIAALLAPLGVQAYETAASIDGQLRMAREAFAECQRTGEKALALRERALALYDRQVPGSYNVWDSAEQQWAKALEQFEQADTACDIGSRALEEVLERKPDHDDARRLRPELPYRRLFLAERFHKQHKRDEVMERLRPLLEGSDGADVRRRLSAPAKLDLVTEPPGARVEIERYVTGAEKTRRLEPLPSLGVTPIVGASLPEGSYLLHIKHPGRAPIDLPVLLTRGELAQFHVSLPEADAIPEGYVYIAPGCFLMGSADPEATRIALKSSPMHRFCIKEPYLIGKTEVTFGDWLEYLESPWGVEARSILARPTASDGAVTLKQAPGGGWAFLYQPSQHKPVRSSDGFQAPSDGTHWRQLPLVGVAYDDLNGFLYWLSHSGRLPGARLCLEQEWERGARGADGRTYPHGDQLHADDANIARTDALSSTFPGPHRVGLHPASRSPYGLDDMAGNASEMAHSLFREIHPLVTRGGNWHTDHREALVAGRKPIRPSEHIATVGVRLCASFPPL